MLNTNDDESSDNSDYKPEMTSSVNQQEIDRLNFFGARSTMKPHPNPFQEQKALRVLQPAA